MMMQTDVRSPQAPKVEKGKSPGLHIIRVLGEGAFGEVKLVVDPGTSCAIAVKCMDLEKYKDDTQTLEAFRKEALLQKKISKQGHENVIRYIGMRVDEQLDEFQIFLEYADGGELFDRIEPDVGMPAERAQFYFRQLIAGMSFIHSCGIVHRDVKPENLLLTKSDVLKISDFGMATIFRHEGKERLLNAACGTLPYASPEVLRGRYRGEPADIWSCGIVLVALLAGELPWPKPSNESESFSWWMNRTNMQANPWKKMDSVAISLLRAMLNDNENTRATVDRIRNHPWFSMDLTVSYSPSMKRRRLQLVSQPAPAIKDGELQVKAVPVSFTQPENIVLLSQDYDPSMDALANLASRMTRFCASTDINILVSRIVRACDQLGYETKDKPPNQLVVLDHAHDVSLVISVYEMMSGGMKRVLVDFRRSRGDGIQFKRAYQLLKQKLIDLVCPDGTSKLELHKLKITP